jgi:hypothetical protein
VDRESWGGDTMGVSGFGGVGGKQGQRKFDPGIIKREREVGFGRSGPWGGVLDQGVG